MKQQQGAALVIVMALLSGALMLGMSGMQSALIDEKLAGNYRASVQAKMNSDSLMSEFRNIATESLLDKICDGSEDNDDCYNEKDFKQHLQEVGGFESINESITFVKNNDKITITMTDQGTNNNAVRDTVVIYQRVNNEVPGSGGGNGSDDNGDGSSNPFESPIVGCEGVTSGGGSTISSYRSSEGGWNKNQPGNYAGSLVRTTSNGADIELTGGGQVHGGVEALGKVYISSVGVHGDIVANGNITSQNSQDYPVSGNIESMQDVIIHNTTKVLGHVKAEGEVRTTQWGFSVGESIYAGGNIVSPRNDPTEHLVVGNRDQFFPYTSPGLTPLEPQECDIVDFVGNSLSEEISRYQEELTSIGNIMVGAYPNVEWRFTPQQMQRYDQTWNVDRWIDHATPELNTLFGEQASIFRMNNLNLTSSPSLRVSGGDVVIVVDGNFTMEGGGPGLVIDPDSSLTVFVAGRTNFGSVLNMPAANSINSNGKPTFSLFSGYSGADTGVDFSSSNRVVANVYAPYANVSINTGATLFGSVTGRIVNVSGGGSIVYDELLVGAFGGQSNNGSPNSTPGAGDGGVWSLVEWQ